MAIWIDWLKDPIATSFTACGLYDYDYAPIHSPVLSPIRSRINTDFRLIPDGAITAAHFIKTPYYVQIHGFWDGTSMNIVRLPLHHARSILTFSPREIPEESLTPTDPMLSETLLEVTSPLTYPVRMSSTRR